MSYEGVREELLRMLMDESKKWDEYVLHEKEPDGMLSYEDFIDAILSHPLIAVLSKDEDLPGSPWGKPEGNMAALRLTTGYQVAQKHMLNKGFRRIEKKP